MKNSDKATQTPIKALTAVALPLVLSLIAARVLMPPAATQVQAPTFALPELLEDGELLAGASLERRDPTELPTASMSPQQRMRREHQDPALVAMAAALREELAAEAELEKLSLAGQAKVMRSGRGGCAPCELVAIGLASFVMLGLAAALVDQYELAEEEEEASATAEAQQLAKPMSLRRCISLLRQALAMVPGVTVAKGVVVTALAAAIPVVFYMYLQDREAHEAASGAQFEASPAAQAELEFLSRSAMKHDASGALDAPVMVGLAACAMLGVAVAHVDAQEMQCEASEE